MAPGLLCDRSVMSCYPARELRGTASVVIDGQELASMSSGARSDLRLERLGFVFQSYNLIPVLSAYENAEFVLMLRGMGKAERQRRVMETLHAVGLEGMEHRRPNQLSGGQQQRVAVARAIVMAAAKRVVRLVDGRVDADERR